MIDLRDYKRKVESLDSRLGLRNLCGCQVKVLSQVITEVEPKARERLLALIYLESLLQGFVYSYDPVHYWDYISMIGGKQITMCYHGDEIQFRLMLMVPQYDSSFDQSVLSSEVQSLGSVLLPKWLDAYGTCFGDNAAQLIKKGVHLDSDVTRLINEFPFLKVPIQTTFGLRESA